MDYLGLISQRIYRVGPLIAVAGEGAIHLVEGNRSLLIKVFNRNLSSKDIAKISALTQLQSKLSFAALPIELVCEIPNHTPVGFVQPFFSRAVPLTRALDSYGRASLKLPDDLTFRVKLCRLLSEAFVRIHAANLVIGDVSDGNFLLGRDWFGRATVVYAIDCNSFQVSVRTKNGNEFYPSGVATEEYAAPEVQPTDWSTSQRSVFSDSFGFAILAWKLLFNGSHPFAVITPRSVDVPPLGQRIEKRLFPFCPGSPLPPDWKTPDLQPSLAILPVEIREMFFRTFSASDPRDRATAEQWSVTFRAWETLLMPSLPLRILGAWNGSLSDRLGKTLTRVKPFLGRGITLTGIILLAVFFPQLESASSSRTPDWSNNSPATNKYRLLTDRPPTRSTRPRVVDRDLFPDSLWNPSPTPKE